MSNFVVLEIQKPDLLVVVGRTAGKRIQLDHAFSINMEDADNDEQLGNLLKEKLSEARVSKCDAIAIVGRQDAEMRELTVPPAPNNELPDLIRFQARSDFGSLNENWSLDFVPFNENPDAPRDVLAAAVSPKVIARFQTICDTSNLKLKHVLCRPFATVDLLRSRLSDGDCRLIVDNAGERIDLTVARGTTLLATRSVKPVGGHGNEEFSKQLIGQIRRTIASVSKRIGNADIQQIILCQDDTSLAQMLQDELKIDVESLDIFETAPIKTRMAKPEIADRMSAVFGALLQHDAGLAHEIDFLNPRKQEVKQTDYRRMAIIAGAAVIGFLLLSVVGWFVLNSQKNHISQLTASLDKLKEENSGTRNGVQVGTSSDQIIGEVGKIDAWKANDVNWLEEMYEISDRFMTPDEAIVDSFEAAVRRDVPGIKMVGRAAGMDADKSLKTALMERPFSLEAPKTTTTGDDTYTQSYEYNLTPKRNLKEITDAVDESAREFLRKLREANAASATTTTTE